MEKQQFIPMVDLRSQYERLRPEVDAALQSVLEKTAFINGPEVALFAKELTAYLNCEAVVPCANGTDALQIALMALGLERGDEVIVPAFTYAASAEVIALLGLTPVFVDVSADSFNISPQMVEAAITSKTRAIMPVHLFGQAAPMAELLDIAAHYRLYLVEDNAQSIGACYTFPDGRRAMTGTMGHIGCTSFFPSKNLGCYGDGGALTFGKSHLNGAELAEKARQIANHGQSAKYCHEVIGCNSRLDTLQAAVLREKLKHLESFSEARRRAARFYDEAFKGLQGLILPQRVPYSTHVYHQYTICISRGRRDALQSYLAECGIASAVYYPLALHQQSAYAPISRQSVSLVTSERLAREVLSLPMHTELTNEQCARVADSVITFLRS